MNWDALRTVLPAWLVPAPPTTFAQMKVVWREGDEQALARLRDGNRTVQTVERTLDR